MIHLAGPNPLLGADDLLELDDAQLRRPHGQLPQLCEIGPGRRFGPHDDVVLLAALGIGRDLLTANQHTECGGRVQHADAQIRRPGAVDGDPHLRLAADQRRSDIDDARCLAEDLFARRGGARQDPQIRTGDDEVDGLEVSAAAELGDRTCLRLEAKIRIARQEVTPHAIRRVLLAKRPPVDVDHLHEDRKPVGGPQRVVGRRDNRVVDAGQPADVGGHLRAQPLGGVERPSFRGADDDLEL